ncbi:MAG: hypothetical protein ABIH35_00895 [Patescibacteria group bacterium]
MTSSVFLARLFAIVYLTFSVGFFLNADYYKKTFGRMLDDFGAMYLGGFMALVAGFAIVSYHNIWENNWTVLVTIVGWIALIKGILLLVSPKSFAFFKPLFKADNLAKFIIFPIILGLVFAYFGFLA